MLPKCTSWWYKFGNYFKINWILPELVSFCYKENTIKQPLVVAKWKMLNRAYNCFALITDYNYHRPRTGQYLLGAGPVQ